MGSIHLKRETRGIATEPLLSDVFFYCRWSPPITTSCSSWPHVAVPINACQCCRTRRSRDVTVGFWKCTAAYRIRKVSFSLGRIICDMLVCLYFLLSTCYNKHTSAYANMHTCTYIHIHTHSHTHYLLKTRPQLTCMHLITYRYKCGAEWHCAIDAHHESHVICGIFSQRRQLPQGCRWCEESN